MLSVIHTKIGEAMVQEQANLSWVIEGITWNHFCREVKWPSSSLQIKLKFSDSRLINLSESEPETTW